MLSADDLGQSLSRTGRRVAAALALPWAAIELAPVEADYGIAVACATGAGRSVRWCPPPDAPSSRSGKPATKSSQRSRCCWGAALDRQRLQRNDRLKTAMLRAVSHDLRSQPTPIIVAAHGLDAASIRDADRHELAAVVDEEASRLAGLVDESPRKGTRAGDRGRLREGKWRTHRGRIGLGRRSRFRRATAHRHA